MFTIMSRIHQVMETVVMEMVATETSGGIQEVMEISGDIREVMETSGDIQEVMATSGDIQADTDSLKACQEVS
jgi:hypothetical protein